MNFSLRSLLLSLSIVALGIYALTNPSRLLLQITFTCTVIVFLFGILIAKYGERRSQCFAFGFTVFGIGYLAAAMFVGGFEPVDKLDPPLLTNVILEKLYFPMTKPIPPPAGFGGVGSYGTHEPPRPLFRKVGHTVFSWLFAVVGGTLAHAIRSYVDKTKTQRETQTETESQSST